jgi:hypothetical protein
MNRSTAIKRRRLLIAVPAFIAGVGIDVLIRWLVSGSFMFVEAVACGLAVAAWTLVFAERQHGLPTVDDLHAARQSEEMNILGLANSHPTGKPDARH